MPLFFFCKLQVIIVFLLAAILRSAEAQGFSL